MSGRISMVKITVLLAFCVTMVGCSEPAPPNRLVNEHTFVKVCQDGSEGGAALCLGEPTRAGEGELVQVSGSSAASIAAATVMISEGSEQPHPDYFQFFKGANGEQIRLLYSGSVQRLIAAEYLLDGRRVYLHRMRHDHNLRGVSLNLVETISSSPSPEFARREKELQDFFKAAFATPMPKSEEQAPKVAERKPDDAGKGAVLPAKPAVDPVVIVAPSPPPLLPASQNGPRGTVVELPEAIETSATPRPASAVQVAPPRTADGTAAGAGYSSAPARPSAGLLPGWTSLTLPSGRSLARAAIDISGRALPSMFPVGTDIRVKLHPNGVLATVVSLYNRKLDGPTAALYPTGALRALVKYERGALNGPVRCWNDNREMIFYGEYKDGKADGVCMTFAGNKPVIVQERRSGQLGQEYTVEVVNGNLVAREDNGDIRATKEIPSAAAGQFSIGLAYSVARMARSLDAPRKAAVPTDAEQQEALKLAREVFKSEYDRAKTRAAREAFRGKLLQQAHSSDGPGARFVLLRLAKDIAASDGCAAEAFDLVDQLTQEWRVDSVAMKLEAISKVAKSAEGASQRRAACRAALGLVATAMAEDSYRTAEEALEIACGLATASSDATLLEQVDAVRAATEEATRQFAPVEVALTTLKEKPQDPPANLIVGKHLCFTRSRWCKGLPMLALASDEKLRALAAAELEQPASPAQQVNLADQWWDLGDGQGDLPKLLIRGRAVGWYKKALPGTSGLVKAKVEKRISEFRDAVPPNPLQFDDPTVGKHSAFLRYDLETAMETVASDDRTLRDAIKNMNLKLSAEARKNARSALVTPSPLLQWRSVLSDSITTDSTSVPRHR
jgi:hypothetical protein